MKKVGEGKSTNCNGGEVAPHLVIRILISRVTGISVLMLVTVCAGWKGGGFTLPAAAAVVAASGGSGGTMAARLGF